MASLIVIDRSGGEHELQGEALTGMNLMEIIRDSGVEEILAICGGCCSCSTCHIYIAQSDWARLPVMTVDEDELLNASDQRTELSRLSCQIQFDQTLNGLKVIVAPEDWS